MFGQVHMAPGPFVYPASLDPDAVTYYNYVLANDGIFDVTLSELNQEIIRLKAIVPKNQLAAVMDLKYLGYQPGTGVGPTLGMALKRIFYFGQVYGYAEQLTLADQPLLLRWNAAQGNYFFNAANINNNNLSTPATAANNILGDIDIDAKLDWQGGTIYLCDRTDVNKQYTFLVNGTTARLNLTFFNGAINETVASSVVIPAGIQYVRAKRISATGSVTFYTSPDGIAWAQLGTVQPSTAGALITQNNPVRIGSTGSGVGSGNALIYSMRLYNGDRTAGGVLINQFLGSDYHINLSQNTLTSSATGEVWTVNRSAGAAYKATITPNRTIAMSDGVDDRLETIDPMPFSAAYTQYICNGFMIHAGSSSGGAGGNGAWTATGASPNIGYFGGAATTIDTAGELLNRLQLRAAVIDGAASLVETNNANQVLGTLDPFADETTGLFATTGGSFGNIQLTTWSMTKQAAAAGTLTALYTLFRGWNNNPA